MAEITNREELEAWLKERDDREVSRAIALRAALRVLPLIVETGRDVRETLFLPVFRAVSAASEGVSFSAAWSARNAAVGGAAADAAADAAAAAYAAAAYAAAAAADAADAAAAAYAAAAYAADAAAYAADADAAWRSVYDDVRFLDQGGKARGLVARPLWDGAPPQEVTESWAKLKTELLQDPDLHWDVWVQWYEARLNGGARNWKLEAARANIPYEEKLWPHPDVPKPEEIRRLNLRLKELEIEHGARPPEPSAAETPPQQPAPLMTMIIDGQVQAVAPDAPEYAADLAQIRELLAEEAQELDASCGQRDPKFRGMLNRLMKALGDDYEQMNALNVGYFSAALFRYEAYINQEFMPADAAQIEGFLLNLRLFTERLPEWTEYRAKAQQAAGPVDQAKAAVALKQVIEAVTADPEHFDSEVRDLLEKMTPAAESQTPEVRHGVFQSLNNVAIPVVQHARSSATEQMKGAVVGALTATVFEPFLAQTSVWFTQLAAAYPHMFEWLRQALRFLGLS